jgi:NAD(P)-dependent dehydrogenase (short-subunit alcohol dehydrogenase family)
MLNVNLTSVAVMTTGFSQLLQKSHDPKVINITSGLGSIASTLDSTKTMARYPPYGFSKVGLNGVTAHMHVFENERVLKEKEEGKPASGKINFYSVAPGLLNTGFTGFNPMGRDPKDGAEVVVQIITGEYPGGTQWEWVDGSMKQIPW